MPPVLAQRFPKNSKPLYMSAQQAKKPPTLNGPKIRSRKRDEKTKYEPDVFRDQLLTGLNAAADFEGVSKFLDVGKVTWEKKEIDLDYRRYAEPLFDILICGGILEPGGSILEGERNKYAAFESDGSDANVKSVAQVIEKLLRRYKYLQVLLEDEMGKVLKFLSAFNDKQRTILAKFTAFMLAQGVCSAKSLSSLFIDSLTKDGLSLQFFFQTVAAWLPESTVQSIATTLRKSSIDGMILDLLPAQKRTFEDFKEAADAFGGLEAFVKYVASLQTAGVKRELEALLHELLNADPELSPAEVLAQVKAKVTASDLSDTDVIPIVFSVLLAQVDSSKYKQNDLLVEQTVRHISKYNNLFKTYTSTHNAQVLLLVKAQEFCFNAQQFIKIFPKLALLWYKSDVIEEDAVMDWYNARHSSKGKSVFLESMAKMVAWLKQAEEESEDEEEEN